MSLRFKCDKCEELIVVKFLKRGEDYLCPNCRASGTVPDDATETNELSSLITQNLASLPSDQRFPDRTDRYKDHLFGFSKYNQHGTFPVAIPIKYINFTRAFWLIAVSIFVSQAYSFLSSLSYLINDTAITQNFIVQQETFSIIWYLVFLTLVELDIRGRRFKSSDLYNFDFGILKQYLPKVLKYFIGCAAAVLFLTGIIEEPELITGERTWLTILMPFITAVIMAPVIEEMIFRGYLYTAMIHRFRNKTERLVINAVIFAAAHVFILFLLLGASVPYYIVIIGYLLANLYEESRSILPGILLHLLNNGFVFLLEYLKLNGFLIKLF